MLFDKIVHNSFLHRWIALNLTALIFLAIAVQDRIVDLHRFAFVLPVAAIGLGITWWKAYGIHKVANHVSGLVQRMQMPPMTIGFRLLSEAQVILGLAIAVLLSGFLGLDTNSMLLGISGCVWLLLNYNLMIITICQIVASLVEQSTQTRF